MRTSTRASPSAGDLNDEQCIFGIAEKIHSDAVAGIEHDAVVDRDVLNRLGDRRVELLFYLELLGDLLLGVFDDIHEQDGANERPIGAVEHSRGLEDAAGGAELLLAHPIRTHQCQRLLHPCQPVSNPRNISRLMWFRYGSQRSCSCAAGALLECRCSIRLCLIEL
jgi:hypothetical protein